MRCGFPSSRRHIVLREGATAETRRKFDQINEGAIELIRRQASRSRGYPRTSFDEGTWALVNVGRRSQGDGTAEQIEQLGEGAQVAVEPGP
jgi:hypothetical protein